MEAERNLSESLGAVEIEAVVSDSREFHPLLNPLLRKATRIFVAVTLLFSALAFGAVHPSVYLPLYAAVFAGLACYALWAPAALTETFVRPSASRTTLLCLLAFGAYAGLQSLLFRLKHITSASIPSAAEVGNWDSVSAGLLSVTAGIAFFVLVRTYLTSHNSYRVTLIALVKGISFAVALIALAHWYADNGKLFWVFEPQNVFRSDRARWPFVNSNHLAAYLLPSFFLFCSSVRSLMSALIRDSAGALHQSSSSADSFTRSHSHGKRDSTQSKFMNLCISMGALAIITMSIIASLSRGGWLGLLSGCIFYLVARSMLVSDTDKEIVAHQDKRRRKHRAVRSSNTTNASIVDQVAGWLIKSARPLTIGFVCLLLLFFLNEHGRELLINRIDYGLLYSKDDIRWQLYRDSLPLLMSHPLFGVGFRAWASFYPQVMHPLLSGLNPVYLHSDPLQILIELGLVGCAPLLLISFCLLRRTWALRHSAAASTQVDDAIALMSSLVAVSVAACLDFPFRLPAVMFLVCVLLAKLTFRLDSLAAEKDSSSR